MKKILLISDTHNHLEPRLLKYIDEVDEVWHAGDIGSLELLDQLVALKTTRSVYGNIDGATVRRVAPKNLSFELEGMKVFMTHIGGKVGHYVASAHSDAQLHQPHIFICGHSHILQVRFDKKNNWLYLNPGAMGQYGIHVVQTALSFELEAGKIQNMNVIEFQRGTN